MAKRSPKGERKAGRPYMPGYGVPAEGGEGMLPWSWAVERLSAARNYWVVTVRPDGAPHTTAVWGVWLDDRFYFSTSETSRKARNLEASGACTVAIECEDDETVVVDGAGAIERDPAVIERFVAAYDRNMRGAWIRCRGRSTSFGRARCSGSVRRRSSSRRRAGHSTAESAPRPPTAGVADRCVLSTPANTVGTPH